PGDALIDCTGCASLLRNHLVPGAGGDGDTNTLNIRLEYALVITFLYGQSYECNEYCKYYKNVDNTHYKFIPAVHRTYYDGSISHVTGIVNISTEDYEAMPPRVDGSLHRQGQAGDQRRAARRPRDRADTPEPVPGPQRDQPAVADVRPRRPPVLGLSGVPARRLGNRLTVLPVDIAGPGVRDVPGRADRATRPAFEGHVRSLRAAHVQTVASGVYAQQDDQAQQGLVRDCRRQVRNARKAPYLLAGGARCRIALATSKAKACGPRPQEAQ